MKLLYGSVIDQHQGWGSEYFLNKAFKRNGIQTIPFDYRVNRAQLDELLLEVDMEFDVFFLQRGDYFPISLIEAVNRPRFFFASELVSRTSDQNRILKSGLFKHIFVHSQKCKDYIVKKRWAKSDSISVFLNAFEPGIHAVNPSVEKDIDVLFIGHTTARRRAWLAELSESLNVVCVSNVYGKAMTEYLNRAKIVLNIHAETELDTETRIFEALGSGAFVITELLSDENPFLSGKHLVQVQNRQEMVEQCLFYLENNSDRELIAMNGYEEAMKSHSFDSRIKEMSIIFTRYYDALDEIGKNEPTINIDRIKKYQNIKKLSQTFLGCLVIKDRVSCYWRKLRRMFT